ncbi:CCR4-NOT transcription complex subunit 10 [Neocloeon triangulifer]|uniref:CCR4-NOT transcription complex subunit 10 n=1 Tax=Neocloeon triangulifer TaxID=2078957 RepID=UPI00286EEDE2|nr:CCR4-NOT transcription complex subunit 10 [Neocloeon triangulifer]
MNEKNFSEKLEAFGTLGVGTSAPAKSEAVNVPSISPQEREVAQAALQDYIKGNYAGCLENFVKLEQLRPKDMKLHVNKAIVHFCNSNFKACDVFTKSLKAVEEQVKEDEQDVSSYIHYNLALGLFNLGQISAAQKHLLKVFQCIESLDEGLAQRVCILLIEVFLCLNQAQKALALLSYTENQLLSSYFSHSLGSVSDKSPVITPGLIKHKKEPTTKLPVEPTTPPLPPAFETEWLKSKLAALRARASLQARLWRTNKKDVKSLLAVNKPQFNSTALMAKTYLDFLRGQYNKTARVLTSVTPAEGLELGDNVSTMWFNNLACCHFMGGRNLLATNFFSRAIDEAAKYHINPAAEMSAKLAYAQVSMNLGVALLQAGKPQSAFTYLLKAVHVFPSNPRLWLRIAECCIQHFGQDNAEVYDCENPGEKIVKSYIPSISSTKIILASSLSPSASIDKSVSSQPNFSLQFASLCLKNALVMLDPNYNTPGSTGDLLSTKQSDVTDSPSAQPNQTVSGVFTLLETLSAPSTLPQCTPSIPLTETEADSLRMSVLAASAYTNLCLGETILAVEHAKKLLTLPNVPEGMKFLAQLYAAEGLVRLDHISEAIEFLQPDTILSDLVWDLPEVVECDKDSATPETRPTAQYEPSSQQTAKATMLYNLAVAYAIRGNFDKAADTISLVWQCKNNNGKIPIHLMMLSIYIELQQGHTQNARNLLNQLGIPQRA